jgi:SAM-dependent methyltransferase
MAVVTTIVAFLILSRSGFPIFTELGLFTGLGILFSFAFVHTVLPRILPFMPVGRDRHRPLQKLVNILYSTGKPGALAALLLAVVMVFFARPEFHVSLSSMNTVSQATENADVLFTSTWGRIDERVYLMHTADSMAELQQKNDLVLARIEQEEKKNVLQEAFIPSMIFPGSERGTENLAAWRAFWDSGRREQVAQALSRAGAAFGFTAEAFAPFLAQLDPETTAPSPPIPEQYYDLLGIAEGNDSGLIQFITLVPGTRYDAADFMSRNRGESRIFDPAFFTDRLAAILFSTFAAMLGIIAVSMALLLLLVSLHPALTLLTLLPPAFAYVCTLGTLKLIGHPLDIPALMLSIIILGMGIDYSIFCVRAHQRYRVVSHPAYVQVRSGVFLAGTSTLIGFGVLCFAEHSLLQSIGITSSLGIAYSLAGTFLLLPPLLDYYFSEKDDHQNRRPPDIARRVRRRYRTVEAYPRMFARFKLRFDPIFSDLPRMLAAGKDIRTILDIGCGYGVPACWCLEHVPGARIVAIDPDPERVRIAAIALGDRGSVTRGWAPDLPPLPGDTADVVLLLDMLQNLDDGSAAVLVQRCRQALAPGGIMVVRFTILPGGRPSWLWRLENARIRAAGRQAHYRTPAAMATLLQTAGFRLIINEVAANPELGWLVAEADQ